MRPFKYEYEGMNSTLIKADLQRYNDLIFYKDPDSGKITKSAGNDTYNYTNLIGTEFEDPSIRAMHFYSKNKLPTYRIDFPNPLYYKIVIKINPCLGRANQSCCDGTN